MVIRSVIKKTATVGLVAFVGFASYYAPLKVHSIDPIKATTQAISIALQNSSGLLASVAGSTVNFVKKESLNVFSIKPLTYIKIEAPTFSFLPHFFSNPIQKNPTSISNSSGLIDSLGQTSSPLASQKTSKPEDSVVNIFCSQKIGTLRRTITGSGILINKDGTVLTNAHVAQFPLLSEKNPNVVCLARYGNPANGALGVKVAFISPDWVTQYGKNINTEGVAQTGKSDFALLKLDLSTLGSGKTLSPVSIQRILPSQTDKIYSLSYPADILGTNGVNSALSRQKEQLGINRFYSVGITPNDVIETSASTAGQKGSSGGGILNENGEIIGTITTTANSSIPTKKLIRAMTIEHTDFELVRFSNISLSQVSQYGSQDLKQVFDTKYREYLTSLLNSYLNSL